MNRSEYNRSQTIAAIRHCFIRQYGEVGLEKITVRALCEECAISRTIFYKYFDDKYDVLESIEQELLDGLAKIHQELKQEAITTQRRNTPFSSFFGTAEYIRENEIYFKPLLGIHGDQQFIYQWKQRVRSDLKGEFEYNHVSAGNLDVVTELVASAVIGLYAYWLIEEPSLTIEEISESAGNFLRGSYFDF